MDLVVKNIYEWDILVKKILPELKHKILLLKGNLGAGKTTFTQILVRELGSKDEVNSPTYSIVNEYNTVNGKIFHFDLYKMNNLEEIFDIGIEEYIDTGHLIIVEWPEIYQSELDGIPYHEMNIENKDGIRHISFI